ncbi:DUF4097 family beta strand repeat-containing protein [Salinivirga cyanobacteriivorans]
MKPFIFLLAGLVLFLNLSAQRTFEKTESLNAAEELKLEFSFADNIMLEAWNQSSVKVVVTVNINDGKDNDKFDLETKRYGQTLEIKSNIRDLEDIGETIIKKDQNENIVINKGRHVSIDMEVIVYLPKDIPVSLETIGGDIESNGMNAKLLLKTVSGDIDVSWDRNTGADLELNTVSGKMYSDFDIRTQPQKKFSYLPSSVSSIINNGGATLKLNTVSGNIYFRKR